MKPNKEEFSKNWIESWNSHDLDKILLHYDDSFAIYYKSVMNKNAIEVFYFNEAGKVERSIEHYT